ncbi:hypothetical protein H696_02893 [Fonticula alba]|uniref:Uncharacterized protein n=1 Tax=Fonticula alba TaxID=691883 RepID=A0A058ZAU1_FONAL|nr:hypothetical protein H696_02893 [Fonticula alba]KCV70547.1 hypothetical protein H696_02893 [Fonticula alba]|eukprot:XP_009495063.1 hypothetical protein H696_02893 [Fonticula alba]
MNPPAKPQFIAPDIPLIEPSALLDSTYEEKLGELNAFMSLPSSELSSRFKLLLEAKELLDERTTEVISSAMDVDIVPRSKSSPGGQ